jgi:hypothetical protein
MPVPVHTRACEVHPSIKANPDRRRPCSCSLLSVLALAVLLVAVVVAVPWVDPAAAVLKRAQPMAEAAYSSATAACRTVDRMIGASGIAKRAAEGLSDPGAAVAAVAPLLQAGRDALHAGWNVLRPALSHVLHIGAPTCHSTPQEPPPPPPPQTVPVQGARERAGDGGDGNHGPQADARAPPTSRAPRMRAEDRRDRPPQQPDAGGSSSEGGAAAEARQGAKGAEKKKAKAGGGKRKRARPPQP